MSTSSGPKLDPLTAFDWAAHWRGLVEGRARQRQTLDPTYWDRQAPHYAVSMQAQQDPFLSFLEPYLQPNRTLLDVGAGTGRHAHPLSRRLEWVTAVEPSQGMRERIPDADNMTVIASSWDDAVVAPADLAICCHVLYAIAEPVPFLQKLEAAARERVFVYLRHGQLRHPAEQLWELMTDTRRVRNPEFGDLYNLLLGMGVRPDVTELRYPVRIGFTDLEQAMADCAGRVGEAWDEAAGLAWLRANLSESAGGGLVYEGGENAAGVAYWKPRS